MDERLDDLVSQVNLDEIAYQLTARQSTPIDRLGIPSYYWGTNAIHGMQVRVYFGIQNRQSVSAYSHLKRMTFFTHTHGDSDT